MTIKRVELRKIRQIRFLDTYDDEKKKLQTFKSK